MRWCCVWRPSKSPAIPEGKSWDARARKRSGAMGGHFRGSPITSSVVFKWSAMLQSEEWKDGAVMEPGVISVVCCYCSTQMLEAWTREGWGEVEAEGSVKY